MFNTKKKRFSWLLLAALFFFSCFTVFAQGDFASLRKNINYRAKLLHHELNSTKDTLILSCPQRMYRIYSVGSSKLKIDREIDDFKFKLPLRQFKIGRYLLVTQLNGLKIVFELNILQREGFKLATVSNVLASELVDKNYALDVKSVDDKFKEPKIVYRPYNLTDLNRKGMQTRDECRRIMALQRAKLRAEIRKRNDLAMQ